MDTKNIVGSNQTIREAIQKIALHGLIDSKSGGVRDSGKAIGFIAKIHSEGELAGTVDVQEYSTMAVESSAASKIGYHEGVYLNAMQDSSKGIVMIPKLYSEVVVSRDPFSKIEYISLFSQVDVVNLDAHEALAVGVTEREEFDESSDTSPDVPDLKKTGLAATTRYTKDAVVTKVQGAEDGDCVTFTIDSQTAKIEVGDEKSAIALDGDAVDLAHGKAKASLSDDSLTMSHGQSQVSLQDGVVYVGGTEVTDDAVLGSALADVLTSMLDYMSQVVTSTLMGPQPPANVAAFLTLKAQIAAFKASHTGFLTSKVQIQK